MRSKIKKITFFKKRLKKNCGRKRERYSCLICNHQIKNKEIPKICPKCGQDFTSWGICPWCDKILKNKESICSNCQRPTFVI